MLGDVLERMEKAGIIPIAVIEEPSKATQKKRKKKEYVRSDG